MATTSKPSDFQLLKERLKCAENKLEFDLKKDKQEDEDVKFLNTAMKNVNLILSQEEKEKKALEAKTKADTNLLEIINEELEVEEAECKASKETLTVKEKFVCHLELQREAKKKHERANEELEKVKRLLEAAEKHIRETSKEVCLITEEVIIIEKEVEEKSCNEKEIEAKLAALRAAEEAARLVAEEKEHEFKCIEKLESLPLGMVTVYLRYGCVNNKYHSLSQALADLSPELQRAYDHNRKISTNSTSISYVSTDEKEPDLLELRTKLQVNITFGDAIINVIFD
jgi:hypothetical protein